MPTNNQNLMTCLRCLFPIERNQNYLRIYNKSIDEAYEMGHLRIKDSQFVHLHCVKL